MNILFSHISPSVSSSCIMKWQLDAMSLEGHQKVWSWRKSQNWHRCSSLWILEASLGCQESVFTREISWEGVVFFRIKQESIPKPAMSGEIVTSVSCSVVIPGATWLFPSLPTLDLDTFSIAFCLFREAWAKEIWLGLQERHPDQTTRREQTFRRFQTLQEAHPQAWYTCHSWMIFQLQVTDLIEDGFSVQTNCWLVYNGFTTSRRKHCKWPRHSRSFKCDCNIRDKGRHAARREWFFLLKPVSHLDTHLILVNTVSDYLTWLNADVWEPCT